MELPRGWSGRVFRGSAGTATLHAGDFQLPLQDGEFGDHATGEMPARGTFLALTEYLAGSGLTPGRGLFAARGIRLPLDPTAFGPNRLAHARPGQAGMQHFFSQQDRAFCLYVVVAGPRTGRRAQLAAVDHILRSLQIGP